jgi:type IV pilus assembly protein PilY1
MRASPWLAVIFIALMLAPLGAGAQTSDIETFANSGAPPNILVLLDTSGSMNDAPNGCAVLESGSSDCDAKRILARKAIKQLVEAVNPPDGEGGYVENARFGVFKFDNSQLGDANPLNNKMGGQVWFPIELGNTSAILDGVMSIPQTSTTTLGSQLLDAGRYFAAGAGWGELPLFGTMHGDLGSTAQGARSWDGQSPMDLSCRQSFVIAIGDGMDRSDNDPYDYGPTGSSPLDNSAAFCELVGDADIDAAQAHEATCSAGENWMDDVAYEMSRTDFAPDVPGTQNVVVHTIGFDADPPVLLDAAANGGGSYQTAADGVELAAALAGASQTVFDGLASFTTVTVSASRTAYSDGFFNSFFHANVAEPFWAGHIEAYRLSSSAEVLDRNGDLAVDPATGLFIEPHRPFWDLHDRLLAPDHPARKILTTVAGAELDFNAATIGASDLALESSDLVQYPNDPNSPFADTEALADALVGYLRGSDAFDEDRDGDALELREAVLGDVFHSTPVVIGPPPMGLAMEEGYGPPMEPGTFIDLQRQRRRILYAGANDGMLHAVNAGELRSGDNLETPETEDGFYDLGTGNEEFAYVPGQLLDQLKFIPRNVPRTHYYVDGPLSAGDAWLPSSASDTTKEPHEWTTVLIAALREGGAGYLALDVTDPDATSGPHGPYPKLLWEFDDPNQPLGESWSEAIITRVRLEGGPGGDHCGVDNGEGDCRETWVAIFAGGYRPQADAVLPSFAADPNAPGWTADSKAIFMVALDTGELIARVAYDPADAQLQHMRFSLPSTPAVLDLDSDGFADVIYVGDTGGQLWKWDISQLGTDGPDLDALVDNWPVGVFFRSDPVDIGGGQLHYRSIFFPPSASFSAGDLVLAFGTGERTDLSYAGEPAADENNRFYVVRDPNPVGAGAVPPVAYNENDITNVDGLATDPDPTDLGFYFSAEDGEKFITSPITFAGYVMVASYSPGSNSGDPCSTAAGSAFLYLLDLESGGGFFDPSQSPTQQSRRVYLGSGVPAEPRMSVNPDGSSSIFVRTSTGAISMTDGPALPKRVGLVYWKQDL